MILLESTYPEAKNKALNKTMIAEQNEKWDHNVFFFFCISAILFLRHIAEKKTLTYSQPNDMTQEL